MEGVSHLLAAVAAIIWPLIAIAAFVLLFPNIRGFFGRDKVSIKIGGMELSAEQASQSFSTQIIDLQERLAKLEQSTPNAEKLVPIGEIRKNRRILWVDDNQTNNAIPIKKLTQDGIAIATAQSTNEGLALASASSFDVIISDMGRVEGANFISDAGLVLLKKLRAAGNNTPLIFFTTRKAIETYSTRAKDDQVVVGFTNSQVELYKLIDKAMSSR